MDKLPMDNQTPSKWAPFAVVVVLAIAIVAAVAIVSRLAGSQIILGAISLASAIIVASIQYKSAKDKETESRLFSEKQAVYTEMMETIMGLFHERKTELTVNEQAKLVKNLQRIRTKLIIWGSYETIQNLDNMGSIADDAKSGDPTKGLLLLGEIFAAMRKDLGHNDPSGAGQELALGMLIYPDREKIRGKLASE